MSVYVFVCVFQMSTHVSGYNEATLEKQSPRPLYFVSKELDLGFQSIMSHECSEGFKLGEPNLHS